MTEPLKSWILNKKSSQKKISLKKDKNIAIFLTIYQKGIEK
jgi:hypothetical protein